ncbi:hypothetical protein B0T10DRAFT_467566 [Thelonectria olida]|uniref:Uncharacterized protein n=1 Tax=Thelonectria olida TaxID=1576542 RepID=A0A9P8VRC0_9HYPO|nr:hypothetical protein B0T10DRAFT_467566 [Thelonectria olida]
MTPLGRSLRLGWAAFGDLWSQCTQGQPIYVELLNDGSPGSPTAIMIQKDALEIRKILSPKEVSLLPNAILTYSILEFPKHRPVLQANKISKPYLMVLLTVDIEAPLGSAEKVVLNAPLAEALQVDGGQFNVYPSMQSYKKNLAGQLAFLKHVLSNLDNNLLRL